MPARRSCSCTGSATPAGAGSRSWTALAERFEVILFDNRGIGESDAPPGPYTAAEMAADVVQVLDEAGVERAHVLGTSLGGMVAQELALTSPERVDRLVLACTTPGGAGAVPAARGHAAPHRGGAVARAGRGAAPLRRERARSGDRGRAAGARRADHRPTGSPRRRIRPRWAAQAAAGTTFDRFADSRLRSLRRRSCSTGRRTGSSTSGTRSILAERIPHGDGRAVRRRRPPLLLGAARPVRRRRCRAFLEERADGRRPDARALALRPGAQHARSGSRSSSSARP